jgi:signal transduction histidine kinase
VRTKRSLAETSVASAFVRRVLVRQLIVALLAVVAVVLLAPWSLLLESRGLVELWTKATLVGLLFILLSLTSSAWRLRQSREVFEALALAPERVDTNAIGVLADLSTALTWRFFFSSTLSSALLLVPPFRVESLDDPRAVSLALISFTIMAAASVVHYVAVRAATMRAVELSPVDPVVAWLDNEAVRLGPQRRVGRRLVIAVAAPVALVGAGAVLVVQGQLRAAFEQGRAVTAVHAALASLGGADSKVHVADMGDAFAASAAHGFSMAASEGLAVTQGAARRLPTGQFEVQVQTKVGRAVVRYAADRSLESVVLQSVFAFMALLLAGVLARWLGRALNADLLLATRQVSLLGTPGQAARAKPKTRSAQFQIIERLRRSAEVLARRFATFAQAQNQALVAKESAQRMRQLLFACVSHDLKSPLNAILGFSELLRDQSLSISQVECLDLVTSRARELLALTETILDAARVEAGQLRLTKEPVSCADLVRAAVEKADDLRATSGTEVVLQLSDDLPLLAVDPVHTGRALAVFIAHAVESASAAPGRVIRVRAVRQSRRDRLQVGPLVRLQIEYVARSKRPSLLEQQLQGDALDYADRGLILRLSLARAVVELHGGSVDVQRSIQGAALVSVRLPVTT